MAAECGLSAGSDGNVAKKTSDAAKACNSFWEFVRGETGAFGMRLSTGFAQQAGVAQFLESQPVQQHADFALRPLVSAPAETVKTPCQARRKPSQRTIAVFTCRSLIFRSWSECPPNPYGGCQNTRYGEALLSRSRKVEPRSFGTGSAHTERRAVNVSS